MFVYHGTCTGAQTLAVARSSVLVAEFPLNRHESFRAEIVQRRAKAIVVVSRWKQTSGLPRRTGAAIEFAAHRTAGILKLLVDLQHVLDSGVCANAFDGIAIGSTAPFGRQS
jgi:hypothetical protein